MKTDAPPLPEQIAGLRTSLASIEPVTADELSDIHGEKSLAVEGFIIRTASVIDRLPPEIKERIPEDTRRGLADTRNVAAHGYGQLDPRLTVAALTKDIPELIDLVESLIAIDETNADP